MPLVVLIGGFGLSFGSSLVSETTMHKYTAEELKSVCEKAGGSFSQDAGGYGCATNCQGKPGTDCIVSCKNNEKNCFVPRPCSSHESSKCVNPVAAWLGKNLKRKSLSPRRWRRLNRQKPPERIVNPLVRIV